MTAHQFLICGRKGPLMLEIRNRKGPFAAIEAEWGFEAIDTNDGAAIAYNHHDGRDGILPSDAPNNDKAGQLQFVVINHFDFDVVAGALAVTGQKRGLNEHPFFRIASFVEKNGLHRLTSPAIRRWDERYVDAFISFRAWQDSYQFFPNNDATVRNCTTRIQEAMTVMLSLINGDRTLHEVGQNWWRNEKKRNQQSFVGQVGKILIREFDTDVSHLYHSPKGTENLGCIWNNKRSNQVTVSLATQIPGFSCGRFLREHLGPMVGGTDTVGIARCAFVDNARIDGLADDFNNQTSKVWKAIEAEAKAIS